MEFTAVIDERNELCKGGRLPTIIEAKLSLLGLSPIAAKSSCIATISATCALTLPLYILLLSGWPGSMPTVNRYVAGRSLFFFSFLHLSRSLGCTLMIWRFFSALGWLLLVSVLQLCLQKWPSHLVLQQHHYPSLCNLIQHNRFQYWSISMLF